MNLDYKILWFEDIQSSFNAKKRLVKRVVEDLGFVFPEPRNEINDDNLEEIDFKIYDLIIADLNLANGEKGSTILNTIREKGIYTEVVFYSSQGEDYVRNELRNFQIDGAYCADRADDDFIDKVSHVIETTVKKVQDLNNMRGLIMAETSDIDKTMFEIITKVLEKNTGGISEKLIASIFENVNSKVTEKKDKFDKYNGKRVEKILADNVMFDTSEKIKAVQLIIDIIDHKVTSPYKNDGFKTSYSEITKKRNLLGHETHAPVDGKIIVGTGEHAFEFDDEFCVNMRKRVRKYGNDLEMLLQLIISWEN
jgi:hypothetical protein